MKATKTNKKNGKSSQKTILTITILIMLVTTAIITQGCNLNVESIALETEEVNNELQEAADNNIEEGLSEIVVTDTYEVTKAEDDLAAIESNAEALMPSATPVNTIKPSATPELTSTPKPTATATPVSTPKPTTTPAPVATTTPTSTPKPTATATPTVQPTQTPVATPTPTVTPAPTATATPHTHTWTPVYETVHHDEVGHWEDVVVQEAWDENIYESFQVCNACGYMCKGSGNMAEHVVWEHNNNTNYHVEDVCVDTVHHDAVVEYQYVIDSPEYDQVVVAYFVCECGATK